MANPIGTKASEFHQTPKDNKGDTCNICGCPLGYGIQPTRAGHKYHRLAAPGKWEIAYTSMAGWERRHIAGEPRPRRSRRKTGPKGAIGHEYRRRSELLESEPDQSGAVSQLVEVVRTLLANQAAGNMAAPVEIPDVQDRSLWKFYKERYLPLKLRTRRPNTVRLYETTLRTFAGFLNRTPTLDDLNDQTVSAYLSWLRKIGRTRHTTEKERCNLLAIWRFACRQCGADGRPYVRNWPNVDREPLPKQPPQAWTKEQLAALFEAIKKQRGRIGNVPAADWWYALHCVLWDTGERISAILFSQWSWVNLGQGWLAVPAEFRKGGREGRVYHIHPDTVDALHKVRNHSDHPEIFHWPWASTYLWKRYGEILKAAGLPHDSRSKFHRMRRTFASFAEAVGMNATELLGHSSRKITEAYLDPRIVKPEQASAVLFRPYDDDDTDADAEQDGRGQEGGAV